MATPQEIYAGILEQINLDLQNASHSLDDMWEEIHVDNLAEKKRYIAELEWIIYNSVRLSDIMLNGLSEKTYRQIQERFDPE